MENAEFDTFAEENISNILQLFRESNGGAHGSAGTHDFGRLNAIKARVESGIMFLAGLAVID